MDSNYQNNKRIARNTLLLYFRMFFAMGVSLYTSRVLLNTLGVEDYGIYIVVAGVIAMLSFITNSMSTATARFLTFELGQKNPVRLPGIFSAACTIHLLIAVIILILAETIGLWFLETKLVIPPERMSAARTVYHLSVASVFLTILQVPYTAAVLSHERMDIYAGIEIISVLLKLSIVFLLMVITYDKLILYGILLLVVSCVLFFLWQTYIAPVSLPNVNSVCNIKKNSSSLCLHFQAGIYMAT
ncbi:MAG: hypothetical protein LIP01_03855 [Tannerellaceae bacterium]|nr:hypothetical protein [Tannerellaceae bacterium]